MVGGQHGRCGKLEVIGKGEASANELMKGKRTVHEGDYRYQ